MRLIVLFHCFCHLFFALLLCVLYLCFSGVLSFLFWKKMRKLNKVRIINKQKKVYSHQGKQTFYYKIAHWEDEMKHLYIGRELDRKAEILWLFIVILSTEASLHFLNP